MSNGEICALKKNEFVEVGQGDLTPWKFSRKVAYNWALLMTDGSEPQYF